MSRSPDPKLPVSDPADDHVNFDVSPQPQPQPQAAPAAAVGPLPGGLNGLAPKTLPGKATQKRSRRWYWVAGLAVLVAAVGIGAIVVSRPQGPRADVILHKVKKENLAVSVTEKGTLESSANTDIICEVRAGTKGFATSVNWVVDDGTRVNPHELIMLLDDSALKDQQESEEITVAKAWADKLTSDISLKTAEITVDQRRFDLLNTQIALERLLGVTVDPNLIPLAGVAGILTSLTENGSYRQSLDDINGQITQDISDVEQNQERAAWSERMVKQAYMSPAQAEADKSRLESSKEKLRSDRAKRALLINYDRHQQVADLTSKRDTAVLQLEQAELAAKLQRNQTEISQKIYLKEHDKLTDIINQRKKCRIEAPANILPGSMVVYFKPEGNRFGNQSQNLIEQGAQVKEGQKMLRIPNLSLMQINTKVHEAMVSRVRGDKRVPTRIVETYQFAMYLNPEPFGRGFATRQNMLDLIGTSSATQADEETGELKSTPVHNLEFLIKEPGQRALVKIDARPDKKYSGHVKTVSSVASQTDVWISDIKLYPTLVNVDGEVGPNGELLPVSGEILKPDMTAEVTIQVDGSKEPVPTIPLQAVIGGAEMGATREVFVKKADGNGYERRPVVLGLFNDKVIEVHEGISEGDEVVTNPKVLLGDTKTKTRDGTEQKGGGKDGKGDGKEGGGQKKKGGGGPPGGYPKA